MTWWLSPLSWLVVAALLLLASRRRPWLGKAGVATALLAWAGATPLVANALVHGLERPRAQAEACLSQPPKVAVVLAGGIDAPQGVPADAALNLASRRRLDGAIAFFHAGTGRSIVPTGASGLEGLPADARLMADYARRSGVPGDAIRVEAQARTTWENAARVAALRPALPRRIVLVTSAMHMARARYAFARHGFEVCAWPTDWRWVRADGASALLPRTGAMQKTEAALHEWVGMAYYRLRARQGADRTGGA